MDNGSKQWYTKYRPCTIDEYSGDKVTEVINRRFRDESKRPNVVLAYGTSGCGKTTLLRMLSKYYLCEHPKEDGSPCEECEMCTSINERLIYGEDGVECDGVTEIDATKDGSKNEISGIIDDALIAPIFGKKKILIIDECHALSPAAQGRLLKVLEDIPSHLVIMMATTDVDKVIGTILNRCTVKIEIRKQSIKSMASVLMRIAKNENLTVSEDALELIARIKDRVPRECINTLEDVAKSYDGIVNVQNVTALCNVASSELYIEFYNASNSGLEDILSFNYKLKEIDFPIDKFINGLMKFTLDAMYIKHGIGISEYTKEYVKEVRKLFINYKNGDFDMLLQILEYAAKMLTSNESRNEVLLTTTAMRVGKIDLLAKGLSMEIENAVNENELSLARHIELIKTDMVEVEQQYQTELTADKVKEDYVNVKEASATAKMLMALAEYGEEDSEESNNTDNNKSASDNTSVDIDDVDAFFS